MRPRAHTFASIRVIASIRRLPQSNRMMGSMVCDENQFEISFPSNPAISGEKFGHMFGTAIEKSFNFIESETYLKF